MKKLFFTLFFLLPLMVLAESEVVKVDNLYYELIEKGQFAKVSHVPYLSEEDRINGQTELPKYTGNIDIPESISYNGVSYPVISIGEGAFAESDITSVIIPNTITIIEACAFLYCKDLESITIGNSIKTIGEQVFQSDYKLKSVFIDDLVSWCNIEFGTTYGNDSNPLCGADLYLHGEKVVDLIIPKEVTSISNRAFAGCSSISSVTIHGNVENIGISSFSSCDNLVTVTMELGVESIPFRAFWSCRNLMTVNIPNSVKSIDVVAFAECSNLKNIDLPNSLESIGESSFWYCKALPEIVIPKNVRIIEGWTFEHCSSLKSITLGENICQIKASAFNECAELSDIYSYAKKIPTVDTKAFVNSYIEYATLHVRPEFINQYKEHETWGQFGKIVAIEGYDMINVVVSKSGNGLVYINDKEIKSDGTYESGTSIEINLLPDYGYCIASVLVNDEDCTDKLVDNKLYYSDVIYDMIIDVVFDIDKKKLTVTSDEGGSISYDVEVGKKCTLSLNYGEDWQIGSVSFNGKDVTSNVVAGKYTTPEIYDNSELVIIYSSSPLKKIISELKGDVAMLEVGDLNKDGVTDIKDLELLFMSGNYEGSLTDLANLVSENTTLSEIQNNYPDAEFYKTDGTKVSQLTEPGIYFVKSDGQIKRIIIKQ